MTPFVIMRRKMAAYDPERMSEWRSMGTVYTRWQTTDKQTTGHLSSDTIKL